MFTRPQSASSRKLSFALEGDGQCHVSQRQAPAGAGLTMTALQGQCWEKPKPLATPRDAVWGRRISSVTLLPNRRNQNFSRGDIRDSLLSGACDFLSIKVTKAKERLRTNEATSGQRPHDTEPGPGAAKGTSPHAVGGTWWFSARARPDPDDRAVTVRDSRL